MIIKKENFREFEFKKIIFENFATPDGNQSQEVDKKMEPGQDQVEFAETPHMDKIRAIETADQTKKEGVSAVIRAAKNPEDNRSITEGEDGETIKVVDLASLTGTQYLNAQPKGDMPQRSTIEDITGAVKVDAIRQKYESQMASADSTAMQPESKESGEKLSSDEVVKAIFNDYDTKLAVMKFIAPKKDGSKVTEEDFGKLLKGHEKFSKILDSVSKNEAGEFNLDKKGRAALVSAIDKRLGTEGVRRPDKEEMKKIGEVKLGKETLENTYGPEVVQILSMKYETRIEKEGAPLQIKNGEQWENLDATSIGKLLPKDVQEAYAKLQQGGTKEDYEKAVKNKLGILNSAIALREVLGGNEKKGEEKMNAWKFIQSAIQLYKMFKDGMETGDMGDLSDALADVTSQKDPIENRKNAKAQYEEKVNKINDLSVLLKMHADPRSGEAARLFGENGVRYRNELPKVIADKLAGSFGEGATVIQKIENANGKAKMRINKDGVLYDVYLSAGDSFTKARIAKVEIKDSQEIVGEPVEANITDLQGEGEVSLKGMLAQAKRGPAPKVEIPATPTPETPPAVAATGNKSEGQKENPLPKTPEVVNKPA